MLARYVLKFFSQNVEGDTAKALSWMFANVAKMMNENPNQAVIDVAPVQRVDDDTRQVVFLFTSILTVK